MQTNETKTEKYRPRNPQATDLHKIIRENYLQVFYNREVEGVTFPFHIKREFNRYLTCGILAHGFARFHCPHCQKDLLTPYSCNDTALIVPGTKDPTKIFGDVISYYDFKVILCNKGAGREKGGVENSVGYCRRNFLAGKPEFDSLDLVNKYLSEESIKNVNEKNHYETDVPLKEGWNVLKTTLRPLPVLKEWGKNEDLLVNSRQYVRYDNHNYSVPLKHVGETLKCFITTSKVKIFDQDDSHIYTHERRHRSGDHALVIDHYYEQLSRKPRAFEFAKVVQKHKFPKDLETLREKLFNIEEKLDVHPNKEFVSILMLQRKSSTDEFNNAIKLALSLL